jgi:magnesium-transporting ATPase (P-type)
VILWKLPLLEWTDSYYPVKKLLKRYSRLDEDAFSAHTRRMGTLNKNKHGYFVAAKGAAESLLKCCTHEQHGVNTKKLTNERINAWLQKNEELSSKGFRSWHLLINNYLKSLLAILWRTWYY